MSGLLALLDDVAGIAKVAAASIDDVAGQAAKAGAKAAGAVIDDAAVTPKYVQGFAPARELPIIWRIAKGSFKNKLLYLLPVALVLSSFAPWAIAPLLMLGGAYLSFEGAEKIAHWLFPHPPDQQEAQRVPQNATHLEEQKASGAIKTDFILSAEIMTIALSAIPHSTIWMDAATLAVVGIGITVVVYGSVALIVKADDVGLLMAERGQFALTQWLGRAVVQAMPGVLKLLVVVGTAAMLWVGGSIVVHGLEQLGFGWPAHRIHDLAVAVSQNVPDRFRGAIHWLTTAAMDGLLGVALGLALIPVATNVLTPVWQKVVALFPWKKAA